MARSFKQYTQISGLKEQKLNTRIAILEDAIRMHRRMVRDGWVSRWRPDRDANEYLWRTIGEDHE
jgi:hypothetical protein